MLARSRAQIFLDVALDAHVTMALALIASTKASWRIVDEMRRTRVRTHTHTLEAKRLLRARPDLANQHHRDGPFGHAN